MEQKWWINYPWRQVQTNLREIDMADIDAAEYVRQLKAFSATVAMINTSGIIASYPTGLDFHYQSPYLTGDSLREIIDACHGAGIRVVARTDFSKVRLPVYERHPEWAYRDERGGIVNYNGDVHVCINSDYQQKYALEIMAETIRELDVDGIFFNMGGFIQRDYSFVYYGICHCARCREKFADFSGGMGLPKTSSLEDPVYRAYRLFQKRVVAEQDKRVYSLLTDIKPGLCISRIGEGGFFRQEANTALDRPLPRWQYDAAENTKHVKSSYGPEMISSSTSVDFLDFPARHTAVSPYQQSMRLYQSLAQGGALDYYLIGRLDNHQDRSGYAGIQSIFRFHSEHEDVYRNDLASNAKIALIKDSEGNTEEYRGWYRFLAENHFLFDTPKKDRITKELLERYEAVILPDCKYLSDSQAKALDGFVKAGGKLAGVYETGLGDDKLAPRKEQALRCLGMAEMLTAREDMRGSYFTLEPENFPSLPETELIYLDECYLYARYEEGAKPVGELIPPQMFGPPERCYPTAFTSHPGAVLNSFGKGRALYLPWRPGGFYYRQGYSVYLAYIRDLLGLLGIAPLNTDLPEMVEVASHTAGDSSFELLSLVNNTGHFGLSFFAPVGLGESRITVPVSRKVTGVRSLMLDRELSFTQEGNRLALTLPELGQYDAVQIRL